MNRQNIIKCCKVYNCFLYAFKFVPYSKKINELNIFYSVKDRYNYVTVGSDALKGVNDQEFLHRLNNSLSIWKDDNITGVWFNVPLECSDFIPILTKNNFLFHHVSHDGLVVIMYSYLIQNNCSRAPSYAHTMIGVGAIVINNNQILTVSENSSPKFWKLPGGFVDINEDIDEAAQREVLEETGIRTTFESLVSMRHMHNSTFQCSDIYFIVKLNPVSLDISSDSKEIFSCAWINIDDFLHNPSVLAMNKHFLRIALENCLHGLHMEKYKYLHPIYKKYYSLYTVKYKDDPN